MTDLLAEWCCAVALVLHGLGHLYHSIGVPYCQLLFAPHRGMPVNPKRYAETFRLALAKAGVTAYVRPFHDGRHSAITNAARAGRQEQALMTLAGHSDSRTTKLYTHLAGELFRPEAERMGSFLWGSVESSARNSEPVEAETA